MMDNNSFPAMPPGMGMQGTVKTENFSVPDRMVGLGKSSPESTSNVLN